MLWILGMYADTLLELSRDTRHVADPEPGLPRATRRNPACGDEITLGFHHAPGRRAPSPCFRAQACAVCRASAAALCDSLEGLSPGEAESRAHNVLSFLAGQNPWQAPWGTGTIEALGAIRERPMRLPCARLPWETLLAALAGTESP